MGLLDIDFNASLDLHNDVERVLGLLDAVEEDGDEKTDGRARYLAYCPVHEADGASHNASLVALVDDHPAPGQHKLILTCRTDCSYKDIARALHERAEHAAENEEWSP